MQKIALLSNININSLKYQLKKEYITFFADGYDTWQQELLNEKSDFYLFQPLFCFLIIDGEQFIGSSGSERSEQAFRCIEKAAGYLPLCRFFISDLDIGSIHLSDFKRVNESLRFESEWEERLFTSLKSYKNVYRFPLKEIVLQNGRNMVYSPKMWYAASNRFSIAGERIITERIRQLIRPALTPAKKCIVLDLDNTLWGGVIGEDGVRGILLDDHGEGARFYDFQKILLEINNRGVLLAIISKNNVEDVEEVFLHPQMLLKKNNFSAMAVGWNSKSENIVQIAHEINIGLDSLVFIDDNPVEREEMRQNRPEVVIADFPGDTTHLYQFAVDMYNQYFYTWDISSEDIHKTKIYEENAKRLVKMKDFSSIEDFLVDMDIKLSVKKVDAELLVRVYQMIQKTNQFNVTSKRYSEEELVKMLGDDKTVMLLGNVQDKYGDNGNSILLIARMVSNHEAEIDSFLMSCRIMNRTIEFGFLYAAEKVLQSMGADVIYAVYFQTSKNSPAEKFFDDAGYELITSNPDTKRYRLIPHVCNEEKRKKYYGAMLLSCTIKALEL